MNQIDLFTNQNKKQEPRSKSPGKLNQNRPAELQISKIFSNNLKWKECKIIGKNISIRSYSAACAFNSKLYLYGGYQMLNGSLSDFYSINLNESEPQFHWEEIKAKGQITPGNRSKHALIGAKQQIYLVGGLESNTKASSDIFSFDPVSSIWNVVKPEGPALPGIQSFGSILVNQNGDEKIIIAFGFNEKTASLSNAVYEYNITKNKLSILFEGTDVVSKDIPAPRVGCAIASDNENVYVFGGKDEENRFNDIWSFGLTDYKFKRLRDDGMVPAVRNGHTMNYHEGKLYVFGGIHDITWELDDLHIYYLKNQKWETLEEDSPRKIDKKNASQALNQGDLTLEKNVSKKKSWYETVGNGLNKPSSPLKKNFSTTYNEDGANNNKSSESPGKMLDEQRRKVFYQKKSEMLKNFEISPKQKGKLVSLETSSQAMKNSLDVIGNPDPKMKVSQDKLTDFGKESHSKFLQPLQNNSNIMIGKKPCARDGHCSVLINNELVIVGGDRHQMSFNDIHKLNLNIAEEKSSPK